MTEDDLRALDRQLVANEARRAYLYDDATGKRISKGSTVIGHPTIGIGFNLDALAMPDAVMDLWFATVRTQVIREVYDALPWTPRLPSGPLRAIVDIAYNAGVDGLMGFHKMLDYAQRGLYVQAATEIINSRLARGRAERLAKLMKGAA